MKIKIELNIDLSVDNKVLARLARDSEAKDVVLQVFREEIYKDLEATLPKNSKVYIRKIDIKEE